jgi:hypothetical protein
MQNQPIETVLEAAVPSNSSTTLKAQPVESSPDVVAGMALHTGWEVVVGAIVGMMNSAEPLVTYPGSEGGSPVKARTLVAIRQKDVGQQVVLAFEEGDIARPMVLGLVQTAEPSGRNVTIEADGDRFVVHAEREIELRCGEASITLTRAGKVLIKGEYVLTRAKGVNRIKGAAVSIN